jgi:hypothetical protein
MANRLRELPGGLAESAPWNFATLEESCVSQATRQLTSIFNIHE